MQSIKAILIDDEKRARNVLSTLLERNCPSVNLVAACSDLLSGVEAIKAHKPDVVFLDIQMPKYNGYEIVNHLDCIDFEIIFVTAYDNYAIKAFEMSALDYIVKPIDRHRLVSSIEKMKDKMHRQNRLEEYRVLVDAMKQKTNDKIVIPELGNRRIVELEHIISIEAEGAYTHVHLSNDAKITIAKNLKYFEKLLSDHRIFFRTHRSWLVNLKHVKNIHKSNLNVSLTKDIQAKISRNKVVEFEKAL